ncbi:50S ribosomal protein L11 methyltransferase [Paradevosia shaoguanensis]|uniref:Ribosomal protein L11 methyltransferase n=1 Tax=Paradevosia shaoguanensis TaxID=1335043 RepID=A0AA41QNI4_9HYPH|nr:50S ribosomal protein L11 methyltransferase [Paradevosia shaoguanensis]MCF1743322.1 50S ribosomal protein L11 methyltransferase [Paradevosia shaoguanensis]MCI0127805.1 50S ribosomal protein L11 methyltransferase [Paradevosia shaoguanensis]
MTVDQVSVALTKDQAYALVDAVMEREDLAFTASAHEDVETGEWVFEATVESPANVEAFNTLAREVLGGDVDFVIEAIDPEINWVAKSLEGLQPVTAGGFYIYGSHETAPVPEGLIGLRIDAAQAFGTGHHETTTGCLEAIDRVLERAKPANVIDIGTGTGVLAIAIAKKTGLKVLATDIDPIAVTTTVENARDNDVAELIEGVVAEGLDSDVITAKAPYDLILANILAGPLMGLAPGMSRIAQPGASIILSGILETQAQGVIAAYAENGMPLLQRLQRKEWTTLILHKL